MNDNTSYDVIVIVSKNIRFRYWASCWSVFEKVIQNYIEVASSVWRSELNIPIFKIKNHTFLMLLLLFFPSLSKKCASLFYDFMYSKEHNIRSENYHMYLWANDRTRLAKKGIIIHMTTTRRPSIKNNSASQ